MKKGYDMDHMVKVVDEASGVVIAMLDDSGPWAPALGMWADLARKIGEAYGCDEVALFRGDKKLLVKVTEGCT